MWAEGGGACVDALSTRVSKMDMILRSFSMLTDYLSPSVHSSIVRSFSTVLAASHLPTIHCGSCTGSSGTGTRKCVGKDALAMVYRPTYLGVC